MGSEVWEDLGFQTPEKEEMERTRRYLALRKNNFESDEITENRRKRNMEAIQAVFPVFENKADRIAATANYFHWKFEFWPATDCWFFLQKQLYGNGIEQLCSRVLKKCLEFERNQPPCAL